MYILISKHCEIFLAEKGNKQISLIKNKNFRKATFELNFYSDKHAGEEEKDCGLLDPTSQMV